MATFLATALAAHWSRHGCFASMASHVANLPASAAEVADAGGFGDVPVVVLAIADCVDECRRPAVSHARGVI